MDRDWAPLSMTVTKAYVVNGVLVCDVIRPGTPARAMTGVPVLVQGGGARGFVVPPSVGSEVLVAFTADAYSFPSPYIQGSWASRAMSLSAIEQEDDGGDTADPTVDAGAVAVQNAGAQIVLDRYGAVRTTPASGQPYRVEMNGDGTMIVSLNGDGGDRAVVTGALVGLLQQWSTQIVALQTQVAALSAAAIGVPTYVPIAPTTPLVETLGSAVLRMSGATPSSVESSPEN